jgi:hypothetical protein
MSGGTYTGSEKGEILWENDGLPFISPVQGTVVVIANGDDENVYRVTNTAIEINGKDSWQTIYVVPHGTRSLTG